ncbi:hypothetical protein EV363DRAFT_1400564 [Boletus edulis]|nr:hypothetical protein EV363DRAFT_1400564 [Boletus edulis]
MISFDSPFALITYVPHFDIATPFLLPGFLEDIDVLGSRLHLDDVGKIKLAIYYAALDDAELWEMLPEAFTSDWDSFIVAVKYMYSGCKDTDHLLAKQPVTTAFTVTHISTSLPLTPSLVAEVRTNNSQFQTLSISPGLPWTISLNQDVVLDINPFIFELHAANPSSQDTQIDLTLDLACPQNSRLSFAITTIQPGDLTNHSKVISDPELIISPPSLSALIPFSVLVHPSNGLDVSVTKMPIPLSTLCILDVSKYFHSSLCFSDYLLDYPTLSSSSSYSVVNMIMDPMNIIPIFPIWKSDVLDPSNYSPCKSDILDSMSTISSSIFGFHCTQSFFNYPTLSSYFCSIVDSITNPSNISDSRGTMSSFTFGFHHTQSFFNHHLLLIPILSLIQ